MLPKPRKVSLPHKSPTQSDHNSATAKKPSANKKTGRKPTDDPPAVVLDDYDMTCRASALEAPKKQDRHHVNAMDAMLEPFYYGKHIQDPINTAKDKWNLLPAFLRVKGLIKQHIDSFNFFLETELKNIVKANRKVTSDVDPAFWLEYRDIRVLNPTRVDEDEANEESDGPAVNPHECRLRDMTYAAPIVVDIVYLMNGKKMGASNVKIGRMPIMLRSANCVLTGKSEQQLAGLNECSIDPGGYFIVRGQEKVILVQEQLSKNRVILEKNTKGGFQASVTSSTHERKSKTYVNQNKDRIYLKHNFFTEEIPIAIVFKAMGIQSDSEIIYLVAGSDSVYQDLFLVNLEDTMRDNIMTQQKALEYIGQYVKLLRRPIGTAGRRNYQQDAIEALSSMILTHVPVIAMNFQPKVVYLAYMVRRVLMAMHDSSLIDDRDYVGNKRLELAGQMLSLLFEDLFKSFNLNFKKRIDNILKKLHPATEIDAYHHFKMHSNHITKGMDNAISTGSWTVKRFKMERAGITHPLSRLSYISALGMLTRISSQFEKTRKVSGPRALQPSQFGMLCPSDTPEGEQCGLVKNLALMTHITTDDAEDPIRKVVFALGAEDIATVSGSELYADGAYLIFINGTPIAITNQPKAFLAGFRRFRRTRKISAFVSVHINHQFCGVHIATDEGRICRPLIIVERSRSKVTKYALQQLQATTWGFDEFLSRGLVEYLDVNEENDTNIALYEENIDLNTTHLEIEPFTILGAVAGIIPYPHHNQSPRNTYQCAMGKQAIGAIGYNQNLRMDSLFYLLVYPQKPLVKTRTIELIKYDKLPAGQNATVAVMSYSGYDIEDALVLNKASCDRGFGRCQVYKKTSISLSRNVNGSPEVIDMKHYNPTDKRQHKLGHDGIVEKGIILEKDDIFALKRSPNSVGIPTPTNQSALKNVGYRDNFPAYKTSEPAIVDQVCLTASEKDITTIKVLTRQTRRPELGDKFSSRHGQKGVVGIIAEQADLPFDQDGICPDIIMNPHGFPSRMTVGKMLELVAGKAGVLIGELQYGTAFGGSSIEDMGDELIKHGYSYEGKDMLTCGISGETIPAYVFTGPIYYQKLKHMVQDKMHARAYGPVAILTRQPTEGRARDGGLRFGEMERDCLISYGTSQLLRERLMLSSDKHVCDVCSECGQIGYQGWCQVCQSSSGVRKMVLPYATKLLIQELSSMNVRASLRLVEQFPT